MRYLLAASLLGLLTTAAPVLAATTPLIPRALLFGNPARVAPRLSPDGTQVSWLAPDSAGVLNLWVTPFGKDEPRQVSNEGHRPIYVYGWAGDGRHLLYFQDGGGDETDHLFSVDLVSHAVRDLTPFHGVRAQNLLVSAAHPAYVFVGLNRRDPHVFDMYRVELASGALTLAAQNPGDVLTWTPDWDFTIRAATAFDPATGNTVIRIRDAVDQPWRDLVTMPFERALFDGQVVNGSLVAAFDPANRGLILHSALHSDMGRLVHVDGGTGKELETLAADPHCDIASNPLASTGPNVLLDEASRRVVAVEFDPGQPRWQALDPALGAEFARIAKQVRGHVNIVDRDHGGRRWLLAASASDQPPVYWLYDRDKGEARVFFASSPELAHQPLAAKQVVVIPARDGLPLVSYLTLPPGAPKGPLPLVLDIHGGPWFRWTDAYEPEVQLLANRGYAVLQVNYRGSTGFGLKFLNASTHQWGRGTQDDLYDAVRWAIAKGIADPHRIAALGWSGGGYGTLCALWQQPELFACGVDGVGPGDLVTLFHSFPTYWDGILVRWRRRVGDVEHDDALNRALSPRYHADAIRAPLLIGQGQNDPRVSIANSDAMVKSLRDAGREVSYVVYPDEGHGFARPENNLDFYGRVEEFLAKRLGGRAEPWVKVDGSTAEVR